MSKLILAALALSLGACNSVTTTRMTYVEQTTFLSRPVAFHGAYGTYLIHPIHEPPHFRQAAAGDYGHGAGE